MAFENINWFAPATARQAEAANFQNMIGQFVADRQRNKELELKRLELENAPVDVIKVAENALLKRNQGMQLTPQEEAAIQTAGQISRPQIYTDQFGQQVIMPSPWSGNISSPSYQASPIPQNGNMMLGDGSSAVGGATFATPEEQSQLMQMVGVAPEPMGAFLPPKGGVNKPVVNDIELSPDISAALQAMNMPRAEVPQKLKDTPYVTKFQLEESRDMAKEQRQEARDIAKENRAVSIKQAEEELKTQRGQSSVQKILARMDELNNELKKNGGIISSDMNDLERAKVFAMTTDVGQGVRKIKEPKIQALAEEYQSLQSTLLPYYASAAGLGAKSLDSEGERKTILSSFGSPQGIYEANKSQIENLRKLFGAKQNNTPKPTIEQIKAELARRQGM